MSLDTRVVPVTPLRQNCTIISNEAQKAVIIDPGGDAEHVLAQLEGMEVEAILLTHGHFDHVGAATQLKTTLSVRYGKDVPILGPAKEDDFLLKSVTRQADAYGIRGMNNVTPDRFLEDGERLVLLGHDFDVARVPGHTPGHIVFIDSQNGCAIVGDTLFRGTVGRSDFAYGNGPLLLKGIKEKLFSLPDKTVILCGHGLPTTIGEERRHNPYFNQSLTY